MIAVLSAMDDTRWRYGSHLTGATGYGSSEVSRLLARLERAGMAESQWEEPQEAHQGDAAGWNRGRRHLYRLNEAGMRLKAEWTGT
jgi:DNA-binding PadR family transcriptional regulator